ncbi:class I SAM-dependent methyltransferase [Neorhizobium petrolearium]|uniref:class I SAM-dependent methyltransferase n=1 Tax=Neorhizobium petrolearium TaxID=515361 RepID=UPI003F7D16A8
MPTLLNAAFSIRSSSSERSHMPQAISVVLLAAVLLVCLSLLFFHALTRVPSWPLAGSEAADVVALLRDANLSRSAVIYDLGCGWGSLVIALAKAFPDAHVKGIEISPFPCFVARLRTWCLPNVSVVGKNFYRCDLADADAVTCYLMPSAMPKLSKFLDETVRPGTAVLAVTFWFRDRSPKTTKDGPGLRGAIALYVWPANSAPDRTL